MKLRVSFDAPVCRKDVLTEFSHCIETHLDVVVEFIEVQRSVPFKFCFNEDLIEFW